MELDTLDRRPALAKLVRADCAVLTPETVLKWAALAPAPGALAFTAADRLADFARSGGQKLRGHTLLWRRSIPAWAKSRLAEGDWTVVRRFFASVIPRYGDVVDTWDVVNEPLDEGSDGGPDPFLDAFGDDYVRRALDEARLFAPHARLVINEWGLEYDIDAGRRTRLLRLAERLRSAGAPLDGIGIQGHLRIGRGVIDASGLAGFLRELAGLGLFIEITELDVKERDLTAAAPERDVQVADEAARFLDAVLPEPAVRGVSTWGLSDEGSWLRLTPEDLARFPGAWRDGSSPGLNRGAPYDAALRPKPLRATLVAAFARHEHL